MSTHKNINRLCAAVIAAAVLLTAVLMAVSAQSTAAGVHMAYQDGLFDTSKVHTIDIVCDDWDSFIETCENEEYVMCTVAIDGNSCGNVGIRAKGNTSLSSVSSMNSTRYSFKIEFDHYQSGKTYYGLDKLSLNNLIQDNTYMKDYLTYRLMYEMDVASPLCSYAVVRVNGEDWGLYLAVEGVEESFLRRNYGNDYGELYKPDNMSMGGGRGNGKNFDFADMMDQLPEDFTIPDFGGSTENGDAEGNAPLPGDFNFSEDFDFSDMAIPSFGVGADSTEPSGENPFDGGMGGFGDMKGGMAGFGGGMGSSDVKLQYSDDNPQSYSNIFDNAKTDITDEDKTRLIQALKDLSMQNNIAETVDVQSVINYFAVHNFVCNFDSYTGSIIHNYYLYEKDGQLQMIPWDYNLAFGTFQSGDSTQMVNYPIDSPVSGSYEDRPMISWIFDNSQYLELYHQTLADFINEFYVNGRLNQIIDETYALISPYVAKDSSAFCSYEEFEIGVDTLREFCSLRAQSVQGQLSGTVPSTEQDQQTNSQSLIDASHIDLSDMGSMGGSRGNMNFGGFADRGKQGAGSTENTQNGQGTGNTESPQGGKDAVDFGSTQNQRPNRSDMPSDTTAPNTQKPEGMGGFDAFSDMQGNMQQNPSASAKANRQIYIEAAVCFLICAAAIVFALLFKRRKNA